MRCLDLVSVYQPHNEQSLEKWCEMEIEFFESMKSEENGSFRRQLTLLRHTILNRFVCVINTFVCKVNVVIKMSIIRCCINTLKAIEDCCFYRWLILFVWFNYCALCVCVILFFLLLFEMRLKREDERIHEKGKTTPSNWESGVQCRSSSLDKTKALTCAQPHSNPKLIPKQWHQFGERCWWG